MRLFEGGEKKEVWSTMLCRRNEGNFRLNSVVLGSGIEDISADYVSIVSIGAGKMEMISPLNMKEKPISHYLKITEDPHIGH